MAKRYNISNKAGGGNKDKHREKLFEILKQLQEAGYRAIEKNPIFFLKETEKPAGTRDNRVWNKTEQGKDKSYLTIKTSDTI